MSGFYNTYPCRLLAEPAVGVLARALIYHLRVALAWLSFMAFIHGI